MAVAMTTSRRAEPLASRLLRGAVGGVLAGMVFAAVTMWFTDSTAGKADMPLRMISTIVKGDTAMAAGTTSVGLGVLVHLVLSALFGMLFALAVPRLRSNGTVALAGTLYGALLYVVNFLVLAPLAFTAFGAPTSRSSCSPTSSSARCCRLRSSALAPATASRSWPSDGPVG